MSKIFRVQFEMDETEMEILQDLMQKTGVKKRKDLFNNALSVFKWAAQQAIEGKMVASIDTEENTYRELNMPALDYAATSSSGADDSAGSSG